MDNNHIGIVIFGFGLVIFFIIMISISNLERFSVEMKRERANIAYNKLKDYKQMPPYPTFKHIVPNTDAVEYIDLSVLKNKGKFTIKQVERVFGL